MRRSTGARDRTGRVLPLVAGLAVLLCTCSVSVKAGEPTEFRYQRGQVLGTSLDLLVIASNQRQAKAAHEAVTKEVERLSRIFNTHDPQSEIVRLNTANRPVKCSPELIEVLMACDQWRRVSGGAFNAQLDRVSEAWKQAEKTGKLPDPADLASLAAEACKPAFKIDSARGTVRRLTDAALNVDALAKGYIIDRALAAAGKVNGVQALLLDIGGDIRAWSRKSGPSGKTWTVGVADPANPADNVVPRTRLLIQNMAVATSGNYERFYTIAGKKHSHILDPRTGQSADQIVSSTTVARDCATADALATIFSVLDPKDSLRLIKTVKGAECMIVGADGTVHTSQGWKKLQAPEAATQPATRPVVQTSGGPPAWPAGYQVTFTLNLKKTWVRPYVAIWVEDAFGKMVKVLAVWGREHKHLRRMTSYWKQAGRDLKAVRAISRPSRAGGKYTLVWDGTDDQGKPVAQGQYSVHIELYRKEGKHFDLSGPIECGSQAASGSIPDSPEVKGMKIRYAKQKK